MIKFVLEKINKSRDFILVAFLWICIWATYNTDIFRFFNSGFPHSFFDLVHGIRSIFPFIALIIALVILIKRNKFSLNIFKGPLGFLCIYAIIGICASVLSKNPIVSFYWGTLYLTVAIILLAIIIEFGSAKKIDFVMKINWIIAGLLSIGLTIIFLLKPGMLSLLTVKEFLMGLRPYEGIGGLLSQTELLGMAGTRPTGLGRYAGVAAIIVFANFWGKRINQKIVLSFLFFLFTAILIFTRARTSVIAFLVAIFFISLFRSKFKVYFIFILCSVLILLSFTNFYPIFYNYLIPENSRAVLLGPDGSIINDGSKDNNIILPNNQIITLSGRTTEIWPKTLGIFYSSPLIGRGFQADRIFLNGLHAHNTLIQSLIQSGLIGSLFFIFALALSLFYLFYFIKIYPDSNVLMECVGILTFFAVRAITESTAFFSADYIFIAPIIAYLQILNSNKKHKEDSNKNMQIPSFKFAETIVNPVKMAEVIEIISDWIKFKREKIHWIVVTGMHGIVEAHKNKGFKLILNTADLFVPDGISLVWLARLKGFDIKKRVSGADLMQEFFRTTEAENFSNYFYGDTEETLQALKIKLANEFPKLKIAGMYSPPFRELTTEEDEEIVKIINDAHPDVLWVGLGLPKQEIWIYKHRDRLNVPVVAGVGATFKFLSGKVKRAPKWVGDLGFEWLWRLFYEPKRIWKRVFIDGPIFFWLLAKDFLGIDKRSPRT